MPSLRSLLGIGRQALATRLDHLHNTLNQLGDRLRVVVAEAVGQNVGAIVSQTFAEALSSTDAKTKPLHNMYETNEMFEEENPFRDPEHDADAMNPFRDRDIAVEHEDRDPPTNENPLRLPLALATGLRTAAWWVRRCWTGWAIAGALSIGIVVGWIAFCNQPLAHAGLRLAESADHIQILSQTAKAGAQRLLS